VGRFESAELTREALAHEDFCARPGIMGRCFCLLGTGIMVTGLVALVPSLSAFWPGSSALPTFPSGSSGMVHRRGAPEEDFESSHVFHYSSYGGPSSSGGFVDYSGGGLSRQKEETNHLGLDFSLVALCVSILACCVLPPILNVFAGAAPFVSQQQLPWGQGQSVGGQSSLLMPAGAGAGNPFAGPDFLSGAARGRVVDVKPGELRGGYGGPGAGGSGTGLSAGFGGPFGFGWSQANSASPMDWSSGAGSGGSWTSPVPSPWGSPSASFAGVGASSSSALGSLGSSLGAWLGFAGAGQNHHGAHGVGALPAEAELTETYANFGVELQAWVPAIASVIDREIIEQLIRSIDESDQLWQQALAPRGWRLTTEAPRLAHQGIGSSMQELSVFDRHLPRPLCEDQSAVDRWNHRQKLEAYLIHPSFEPSQRQYVLDRLREWRHRGIVASAIRYEGRRTNDLMPTDAHILENLLIKMLNFQLDFANCFLSSGQAPPMVKHMGQSAAAYLRQVTDQSLFPRPAPHYEVVAMQKVWKIRPGSQNILAAMGILLHSLKRHSRSYQSFPQALRNAIEQVGSGIQTGQSRPFQFF